MGIVESETEKRFLGVSIWPYFQQLKSYSDWLRISLTLNSKKRTRLPNFATLPAIQLQYQAIFTGT